jgi:DNA-directed RNA polymerase I, II, and III subunit RPABC2
MNEGEIPMTKYEKSRIIGTRALQISNGAEVQIDVRNEVDPLKIAEKEVKSGKIDMIVRRDFPDGSFADYTILPEFKLRSIK